MNISTDQRWSNVYKQGRDFKLVSSREIDRILSYALPEAPKTCLDLGCGTGQLTRELYHRGYEAVGVDASSEAVQRAKQLTIVPDDQLSYLQVDLEHDDLKEKARTLTPYGIITCKLVYAFIEDKTAFLERVKEVIHPKGLFVVVTPILEDVAVAEQAIATNDENMKLLEEHFQQVALYKDKGLTHFVGRPR